MAVKAKKQKAFQDLANPERIIVESPSGLYVSSLLIARNTKGEICAPWVITEKTIINKKGGLEHADIIGMKNHQCWAKKNAAKIAEKKALEEKALGEKVLQRKLL